MTFNFNQIKDFAELFSYVITSFSLIAIWITYAISKKQIHFSAMEKCIYDFRTLLKEFKESKPENLNSHIEQYIDLINEEFFYFENNYLPKEVAIEWIDGMIDFLPFYNFKNEFIKSKKWETLEEKNTIELIKNYPRVSRAIKIKNIINFDNVMIYDNTIENKALQKRERDKLIFEIISNLKINCLSKILFRIKIKNR